MFVADGLSRTWTITLRVACVLVAIPSFIAAGLEGLSSPDALAEMELVWIPGAPLWLVRLVAAVEGLDELTATAVALSRSDIPVMRVTMEGTGHGISDDGRGAASRFLQGVLQI